MNQITQEFLAYCGKPAEYFSDLDPFDVFWFAGINKFSIDNACTIAQDLTGSPVDEEEVTIVRNAFPEIE